MGVAESLTFTRQVLDWYWSFGHERSGKYALPPGAWLDQLYGTGKQLDTLGAALAATRPSVAVWGPSQTGKSTLASRYIDARVKFVGDLSVDGTASGLHFPGGAPCFFLKPEENPGAGLALRDGTLVLNPYNSGLDASACLSRFVLGSTTPTPGLHHVRDVLHPVELKWVKPRELWQSIARGYDSQCFGPRPSGATSAGANAPSLEDTAGRPIPRYPRTWSRDKFLETFRRFAEEPVPERATPSREAYELLHEFCDLIEDLIFAELPRFRQLQSADSNWKNLRHALLSVQAEGPGQRNALHFDPARAYAFTAEVLWDGYAVLSDLHRDMRRVHETLTARWGTKPVLCSLEVAALFLDMETYLVALKPLPPRPRPKDLRIHRAVPALAWEDRGDHIVIGADPSLPHKLIPGGAPEQFAILQGLVWEMVVPLNPDHLEDTPFKDFLRAADLLDFPGVERGGQSGDKVDLDHLGRLRAGQPVAPEPGGTIGERDEPYQFFLRVLKRGKTSSIVCTYAQRLSIDAFNIFQDLDRDKPNGGQLIEGINSWWKECAPDYYRNPRGRSPLPLNFVLLWWANFFNEGQDFTNLAKKFTGLGAIIDPEISTTFALNYYALPRGAIRAERRPHLPEAVVALKAEPAFRAQFALPVSQQSFDAMLADARSGGTDFFFAQLAAQVTASGSGDETPRRTLLSRRAELVLGALAELLGQHELFPDPAPRDLRREHLVRFRAAIAQATVAADERSLRVLNHTLRLLLDVDFQSLLPIPHSLLDLDSDYLRGQLQQWINAKSELLAAGRLDLAPLGLADREAFTQTLSALAESLEPELELVAGWLRRLAQYSASVGGADTDLRRHLALKLGNLLVFGPEGPRVRRDEDYDDPAAAAPDDPSVLPPTLRGHASRYYRDFIDPFAGDGGHLQALADRNVVPITRPDQPGDTALVALTRHTHAHLLPPSVLAAT